MIVGMRKRTYETSETAKREICAALKVLMAQKPLNKITVAVWQDGLLQLFQYLQENREVCLCALHSVSREHLKRFFRDDINAVIQNNIKNLAAQLNYPASDQEINLLTKFYVSALAGITEDWLLGEIQETPEELIRFTDQLLQSHVMGATLRLAGKNMDFDAERKGGR